ncbi:MAG: NACHT domain-containing protein, partial [Symploca sp. SIO1B1]|nr:NACHT domain-containing protein [Symploca sp. SIO1B1]
LNQQPALSRQEYRNRQALLTKVKNFWVKGVLEKSLYKQVLIELGLEERPDAIANPWNPIIETGDSSPQPLSEGTKVIDIFDEIGAGRTLLILGEPGSGKTTTLLELTRDLIARAEQDVNLLIPVVFNLSSWASKRQKIEDWLVEELNSKYDVPKKIGQAWVAQQQLLPLLDGLDEVKADYRDDCITALNQFKQEYGAELVVCSRIKDYEALSNRLNFQSAAYIRLLTLEQICYYLDSVGGDLRGLRTLIAEDRVLQELAQSPLMLNIMTLAYQGVAVKDLPRTEVLEEQRRQLFDDYIERMFNRRKASQRYERAQVKRWLIWLASRMVQESQTVFLIEKMQPYWLKNRKKEQTYTLLALLTGVLIGVLVAVLVGLPILVEIRVPILALIVVLIVVLMIARIGILTTEIIVVLMIALIVVTIGLLIDALIVLIIAGLIVGLIAGAKQEIKTVGILKINIQKVWFRLIVELIRQLIIGLIVGLILGLAWLIEVLIVGLSAGLALGLIVGLISGLIVGVEISEMETTTSPNQGIWKSIRNAMTGGLIVGLITGLIAGLIFGLRRAWLIFELSVGLIFGLREGLREGLIAGLIAGLITGLIAGLVSGGIACIQHFSLRLILYLNNYIPWNYAHFLDYATERIFLQKVGGGYIFIHRMLMEHFAQMQLES